MSDANPDPVAGHYTHGSLKAAIAAKLDEAGVVLDGLTADDLAPMDHLHGRGLEATREMLARLAPQPADHILDIGCGIGGPARWIAQQSGCRVTGIDLTQEFIDVAVWLAELTGQTGQVAFEAGDALNLPYDAAAFDKVYTHNVSMSVPDKARFFAEAFRVVKPGGRLVAGELTQGPGGEVIYPVPWAMTADISHLTTADETRALLERAGFDVVEQSDSTEAALAFNARARERLKAEGPPVLSPSVILAERAKERFGNSHRNIQEGRAIPVEFICRRP